MNKLKRSLSLRSSKRHIPESVRPQIWENDSYKVRNGGVSFPVKYVGSIEVTESRGTQVCAEAFRKMKEVGTVKKKRMQLLVTADCVRVVDEQTKSLVIDQTIEKVSFCTPDPSNDRVFSYICREGTTRRWMCHSFIAMRDTGERLSHAVGCAFTACLQRKQKAQALQQQHKEQQQMQQQPGQQVQPPATAAGTPSPANTTPLVNGTSPSNSLPQEPSPGQITTPTPTPTLTSTPTPMSTTAPIASAAVPSNVTTAPIQNGSAVTSTTQQLPSPDQPNQSNATATVIKPPPSVARPRPQPFNPSPFTRHMSLRYRSNPLSFIPLRGDTSGYETLTEEPTVPQLPPAVDALMLQNSTSSSSGTPILQPTVQPSTPSQPATMYNGLSANSSSTTPASSTLLNLSRGGNVPSQPAPLQPYAVPSASPLVSGPSQWGAAGHQQQQPQQQSQPQPQPQRKRNLSEAEMWLASASADTGTPPGTTVQANQGLLTTVNPFAETASQINALSNAWTHDLQASLPTSTSSQPGNTSWPSSPWAQTSARVTNGEEDFASFFASRQVSPPTGAPLTRKDSNPFKPSTQDEVFWV